MNTLINEIFDNMKSSNTERMNVAVSNIEHEIESLLEPLRNNLTEKEYEDLRNLLFSATYVAEREMFTVGFSYAVDLLFKRL